MKKAAQKYQQSSPSQGQPTSLRSLFSAEDFVVALIPLVLVALRWLVGGGEMSSYTTHGAEDHDAFILGVLQPYIVGYARASEVVVPASFLSLTAIHEAPEGLH